MSLTRDEITAGTTFLIGLKGLDGKRFGRAVADMKDAGGTFDPAGRQWTVVVSDDKYTRIRQSELLRYWANEQGAQVERAATAGRATVEHAAGAQAGSTDGSSATRRLSRAYGTDMAEYGGGFSPEERDALGGAEG